MRFVSKEAATFEQYSKARPHFHDVIPSERFCPNGFRNYIILNQTCSKLQNDSIEDSEEDNRLKKKQISLNLGRMPSQLQVFLLPANFDSDGMTSHNHGLTAKTVYKGGSPKSLLSRRISSG